MLTHMYIETEGPLEYINQHWTLKLQKSIASHFHIVILPAFEADFISSQVDVVILEDLDHLCEELLQERPGGLWDGVNRSKAPEV